jgi:hypothetical protein
VRRGKGGSRPSERAFRASPMIPGGQYRRGVKGRGRDLLSTDLTHSDSLSSRVSMARASILLVLDKEAMMGVPVTCGVGLVISVSVSLYLPITSALGAFRRGRTRKGLTLLDRRPHQIARILPKSHNLVFYSVSCYILLSYSTAKRAKGKRTIRRQDLLP